MNKWHLRKCSKLTTLIIWQYHHTLWHIITTYSWNSRNNLWGMRLWNTRKNTCTIYYRKLHFTIVKCEMILESPTLHPPHATSWPPPCTYVHRSKEKRHLETSERHNANISWRFCWNVEVWAVQKLESQTEKSLENNPENPIVKIVQKYSTLELFWSTLLEAMR